MGFRGNEDAQKVIRVVYENNGVVGAVCHGPAALVDVNLQREVSGRWKKVAGFSNSEEEVAKPTKVSAVPSGK